MKTKASLELTYVAYVYTGKTIMGGVYDCYPNEALSRKKIQYKKLASLTITLLTVLTEKHKTENKRVSGGKCVYE
jgi:hypothetical protein